VSLEVAAHADCPVVVVRGGVDAPSGRPVAVGIDDSADGTLAVKAALAEAVSRRVGVVAVRAWIPRSPRPRSLYDRRLATAEEGHRRIEQRILDQAVAASRERHPQVPVTTRLVVGTATHALMPASRDAQLPVIGRRGSGGFTGLPLGSAGKQLLNHALCSVMVVHADAQPAPAPQKAMANAAPG
jgi:nucleotide-binding universal stress UspA family protein